jgi:hypothetical protein
MESVLLVEETGENQRPVTSHRKTLSHIIIPHIIKNQFYWLKDNHMT